MSTPLDQSERSYDENSINHETQLLPNSQRPFSKHWKKIVVFVIALLTIITTIVYFQQIFDYFDENYDMDKISHVQVDAMIGEQAESIMGKKLKLLIKDIRFNDIHRYVKDKHSFEQPKIYNSANPTKIENRELLQLTKSTSQLQEILQKMKNPKYRPYPFPDYDPGMEDVLTPEITDLTFFANELNLHPENEQYKQVEFFRYDKLYNIGQYGDQLPLCVVLVGKNLQQPIKKMYSSIYRQNYSNYRVVHIDDNSIDQTVETVMQFISDKPKLKSRVTLLKHSRQRASLYNRNLGISFCEENDIVVDLDADDWLIGSQVFQMINTMYQKGQEINGKKQQLWACYFTFLQMTWANSVQIPRATLIGQLPADIAENQVYRSYGYCRTTQLRTYLYKLYQKIDKNDFEDDLGIGQKYHVWRADSFIHSALFEMASPKHLKFMDEFMYFYTGNNPSKYQPHQMYSALVAQCLPPYVPLKSLDEPALRNMTFVVPEDLIKRRDEMREKVIALNEELIKNVLKLYKRDIRKHNFLRNFW